MDANASRIKVSSCASTIKVLLQMWHVYSCEPTKGTMENYHPHYICNALLLPPNPLKRYLEASRNNKSHYVHYDHSDLHHKHHVNHDIFQISIHSSPKFPKKPAITNPIFSLTALLAPPFSLRKDSSIFTISCKFLQGPSGPGPNFSSARSRTSCRQLGMGLEPKTCLGRAKKRAGEHGWEGEDDQNCFHWWEHNKSYLYVLKTLYVSLLELNNNNNYYNKIWNPTIYIFIHSPVHMEKNIRIVWSQICAFIPATNHSLIIH